MLFQITGDVHRIEFGEHPRTVLFQQGNPLCGQAAGAYPDGVDPVVVERLVLLQQLVRDTAVQAPHLNVRAFFLRGARRTTPPKHAKAKMQIGNRGVGDIRHVSYGAVLTASAVGKFAGTGVVQLPVAAHSQAR